MHGSFVVVVGAKLICVLICATREQVEACVMYSKVTKVASWGNVVFKYIFSSSYSCPCSGHIGICALEIHLAS